MLLHLSDAMARHIARHDLFNCFVKLSEIFLIHSLMLILTSRVVMLQGASCECRTRFDGNSMDIAKNVYYCFD
ncbi:hypothetical protein BDN70DRAFT_133106 [Pholiota conissans]|uniref:Uncharacterized protein n=1 Tax=Pholiota conissans TaxID=109636 RepID=A0A9P6CRH7_9AGAR|nr:hypothetical protein BDN70DRAFT_133106 [Pholiota conissans]